MRRRETGASSRRSQLPQRVHEEREADAIAQKAYEPSKQHRVKRYREQRGVVIEPMVRPTCLGVHGGWGHCLPMPSQEFNGTCRSRCRDVTLTKILPVCCTNEDFAPVLAHAGKSGTGLRHNQQDALDRGVPRRGGVDRRGVRTGYLG